MILIVLPAYNEERVLKTNVKKVYDFCLSVYGAGNFKIVISDNASTDQTGKIAQVVANELTEVDYLKIQEKGKGAAVISAWNSIDAEIYCFMDMDLATDLSSLPELTSSVKSGADVAIGSRWHKKSQTKRTVLRSFISFGYLIVHKALLRDKTYDLCCGFKAINNKIKNEIVPKIKDRKWFFDSELVILAQRNGYKVVEVPVKWSQFVDKGRKSNLNLAGIFKTGIGYIINIWRIKK